MVVTDGGGGRGRGGRGGGGRGGRGGGGDGGGDGGLQSGALGAGFGDLLALARQAWVAQLERRLDAAGWPGYRRSDAATLRLLRRGDVALGAVARLLGVSHQAARKVVDALAARGLVVQSRSESDQRALRIGLSERGRDYADALVEVIEEMNRELSARNGAGAMAGAAEVLRAVIAGGEDGPSPRP